MHEAVDLMPRTTSMVSTMVSTSMVAHPCNPSTWEVKKEDQELEVIFSYSELKAFLSYVRSCLKKKSSLGAGRHGNG